MNDAVAFTYYSRFYTQHIFWNVIRQPNHIYDKKDIDERLRKFDFHIESMENKQAFRAFLEFLSREVGYEENLYSGLSGTNG